MKRKALKSTKVGKLVRKTSKVAPAKKAVLKTARKKATVSASSRKRVAAINKKIVTRQHRLAPREHPLLTVKYEEALKISPLLKKMGEDSHAELVAAVAARGGDALAFALQGASIVIKDGTFIAKFSADAARLFKAGELRILLDASGKRLPTLIGTSGKTVANARLLGPLAKGTTIAANVAAAVITAAHIVSGIDLAKKMDRLNRKMDFLVEGRRIDKLSRLEGVYRQAKELIHGGLDEYSQKELHRLGRELFEIRGAWRGEVSYHVGSLNKAPESVNQFIAFFQSFSRKEKDEKISETVCACDKEMHLINVCIATHMALAQASGRLDTFLQISLPDELEQLGAVRKMIWEKRDFIHDKHPDLRSNIEQSCHHLDDIITMYRPMVMHNQRSLQNG